MFKLFLVTLIATLFVVESVQSAPAETTEDQGTGEIVVGDVPVAGSNAGENAGTVDVGKGWPGKK